MAIFSLNNIYIALTALIGASIGSFLNVLIFRLPRGFPINLPSHSTCYHCKRRLEWYENIPVLSYLFLLGRCKTCKHPIGSRTLFVEIFTALFFVAIFLRYGFTFSTLYYFVLAAILLAITFIDLDFRIIPDELSYTGIIFGILGSFFVPTHGWTVALLGAGLGGGTFWLLGFLYEKIRGQEGLGFGDVKLLFAIGAFLGPRGALLTIVLSSFLGSFVGIVVMFIQKKSLKMAIPFGPFLALGALTFLFWGDFLKLPFYP